MTRTISDLPIEVPIQHISTLDIEDAFSDGEDTHVDSFAFSARSLREELERRISVAETLSSVNDNQSIASESVNESNGSISSLDINQDIITSPLHNNAKQPDMYSLELDESEESNRFSRVSLTPASGSEDNSQDFMAQYGQLRPSPQTSIGLPLDSAQNLPLYPSIFIDAPRTPPHHNIVVGGEMHDSQSPTAEDYNSQTPSITQLYPTATSSITDVSSSAPFRPASDPATVSVPEASLLVPSREETRAQISRHDTPDQPHSEYFAKTHKPSRSVGPSVFEMVRSKTRPTFLPPKNKQEDERHLADWQAMMKLSRQAAEKRRKALQERRLDREAEIEASLHIWDKEVVPDWRVVNSDPELRRLWWKGIPTKLRASMWEKAVGNSLSLSKGEYQYPNKLILIYTLLYSSIYRLRSHRRYISMKADHYRTCFARAKRALTSGTFPQAVLNLIDKDIETTLPSLHIFHRETGPMYSELKDMICAWVVSRSDEGLGYTVGAAKVSAMLLLNMPVEKAFVVMRNLLERHCMRSFFGGDTSKDDIEAYYRIFDTLLADGMPKVYFNFKQHQISPSAYLTSWLIPLFLDHLPFEACARLWDVILLEGDAFLYRAALGILAVLEPRLFFPDRKELLELLRGENKAAIEVARREGQPLGGGKYEIYGLDEEMLWERIDGMEGWWKESTWQRLIRRELPDL